MSVLNEIKKFKNNKKIWRYMSLEKFLKILTTRKLFLCRADRFEDSLEGSYPYDYKQKIYEEYPGISRELVDELEPVNRKLRQYHYVNCWCAKESESVALWKLYAKKDIAIQSSIDNLINSFLNHSDFLIHLCEVKYIDHTKDSFSSSHALEAFKRKDCSYDFEEEVRIIRSLMYYRTNEEYLSDPLGLIQEYGLTIDIDINKLINFIYISPYADEECRNRILGELSAFDKLNNTNFLSRIQESRIARTPIF